MIENEDLEIDELEIEEGALIPSTYRTKGALRLNTSVCVEVGEGDEKNIYLDAKGNKYQERARAKEAFEDYINIGPARTLEKLARIYADPENPDWTNNYESVLRQLKNYSSRFDWQNRLRIMLTQEAGNAISAARTEQARSTKGRIALAKKLQTVGGKLIDRAVQLLDDNMESMTEKGLNTLLKTAVTALDIGLAAERIEIGEAMENILPPKPVSAMDDNELNEFIRTLTSQVST